MVISGVGVWSAWIDKTTKDSCYVGASGRIANGKWERERLKIDEAFPANHSPLTIN